MILLLGGTLEGREIAGALAGRGLQVLVTVASDYGAEMLPPDLPVEVLIGRLDAAALDRLLTERKIRLIVDATHPYARVITETAWEVSRNKKIPFIRYQRPPAAEGAGGDRIYRVNSYEEGAELVMGLGERIFLTIGSRNLAPFVKAARQAGRRIVARVLPDARVLEECAAMGMAPQDIIAIQGPFSLEMNLAMLREYGADVLVTKDSGTTGGADKKLEAAAALGIPAVIVARPDYRGIPVTDSIEQILHKVKS